MKGGFIRTLTLLLLSSAAGSVLSEEVFYRYENNDGVTVINDYIPPEFAYKGYTVLSRGGQVVKVVRRTLSPEELKDTSGEGLRLRLEAEERQRQKRYDAALLTRYSSVADIESAKDRKLNEVRLNLNGLKSGIANNRARLEAQQQQAAELEREGLEVPASLPKTIESLRADIAQTETEIHRREIELEALELRYALEIERFKVLRPDPAQGG